MADSSHHAVLRHFTDRANDFARAEDERARSSSRLTIARLTIFLALVAVLGIGLAGAVPERIAAPVALLLAAAFAVLVRVHSRVRREEERLGLLRQVSVLAERRAARDWDSLPPSPGLAVSDDHPYAGDLELFGRASVWQLLPAVSPAPARSILSAWLAVPAPPPEVRARQEAVAELAPLIDFRDDLTALATRLEGAPGGVVSAAVHLPDAVGWVASERWLIPVARALTAASIATWSAILFGALPFAAGAIPVAVCGTLWASRAKRLHRSFARADAMAMTLPWYAELIERIAAQPLRSGLLGERHDALQGAPEALRALRRILARAEVRYSPMLHLPLQALGLWDLHAAGALHRWCERHGPRIDEWFRSLGEVEALAAFGGLRYANPDWCIPDVRAGEDAGGATLQAVDLGHPLVRPDAMVANDLTIGPPGTFVLVTGSNMSGKSTLLRAAGLNAVLAQAGAPVCAKRLTMPPLRVWTSVRIQDSLADGVSLFMAELRRLRRVVDAAEDGGPGGPVLYLLDEMLHGTNSAERHIAARTVLARLVRSGSIGLVTTHDVALATSPELAAAAHTVYFDETLNGHPGAPLSFDYRLRPGVVPAGNALRLLGLVGLADPPPA